MKKRWIFQVMLLIMSYILIIECVVQRQLKIL